MLDRVDANELSIGKGWLFGICADGNSVLWQAGINIHIG
jgi:hypothetical protein